MTQKEFNKDIIQNLTLILGSTIVTVILTTQESRPIITGFQITMILCVLFGIYQIYTAIKQYTGDEWITISQEDYNKLHEPSYQGETRWYLDNNQRQYMYTLWKSRGKKYKVKTYKWY